MNSKKWFWIFAAVLLLIAPLGQTIAQEYPEHPEILWDSWGVPHIFSPDNDGLFYAFGWAQAQNHGDLILQLYGEARGRAAEYWGEDYLESDQRIRTLGIPGQAEAGFAALAPEYQGFMQAFADGVNDYAAANPDVIGDEWAVVLPVTPQDIVANGIRVLRYEFVARRGWTFGQEWAEQQTSSLIDDLDLGSNAWAVAPSRSASGNAMLVANPHQPWFGFGLWIEAHMVAPGINMYGSALVGNPFITIGFNEHLGWTHTVNTHDGWDVYQLTLADEGYVFDGENRTFETREEMIRVKQEDGSLVDMPFTVRESLHGPVIAERADGTALALRVVCERCFESGIEWWEMAHATNLQEFEAAISNIRIPMFTIMYADRDGNILHVFNEQVPVRSEGDWAFWNNTTPIDASHPAIIPGDTSQYLWEQNYHAYDDLPKILNPDSGWLQNANEPPWTTTLPLALNPEDYPAYMVPPAFVWPRPVVSMRLLNEDESITFDELVEYKQSTFIELTNWVLDDLIAAASELDVEIVSKAVEVLANWDRQANVDSVGAVLFALWAQDYIEAVGFEAFATDWSINDPLNTPRGLSDPDAAVASLEKVAKQLEALRALGGGIDVPWGDVFRLRYGEVDLPANGAPDLLGSFRTLTFTPDKDLRFRPVQGDSFIAVVEFGETVRAKVLLAYGNATQPGSPHVGDQLALFSEKQLRDAWLTRADIEANLEAQITFEGR
ncbi:MAG: acylase [Anaerolineae bacterium]|nr:acylase [Anaerolineae bacterium]